MIKNIEMFDSVVIKSECDREGLFIEIPNIDLLARAGKGFIHKAARETLLKTIADGKEYNYYPRGRVEIKRGKATIFANGNIADDRLINWAVKEFNLSKENGVNSVTIKADMSIHYLCYLDEER